MHDRTPVGESDVIDGQTNFLMSSWRVARTIGFEN